ncbi:MAG: EAL domain-containing protein [Lachnospiraceae bacterium]|nr:EAL domain-containing protein [Lachnospiraceae bacterium]
MGDTRPAGDDLRKHVIENIDRAIAEDWIQVYYQPVMRTLTKEICGMEALARWVDPDFGMLSPADFIVTLEEERLIHKLDICIIQKLCAAYAEAMSVDESPVSVSFNLSRLDFELCDIHEIIEEAVVKNRIPRAALRIEITESTMEHEETHMQDVIDRFWDRGLRVWMDDFGSGYSSLNVLKDYHFDTLKIDMIFLNNFNDRSREIVKSVVDMSKRIGVHTLAEGVETVEQLDFLRSIGCEKAQGYLIGKPAPYGECLKQLKEKGYPLEAPAKRQYYHDIGRVNVLSATPFQTVADNETGPVYQEGQIPLSLIEYTDDGKLIYLFANESYRNTLQHLGIRSTREIEQEFTNADSSLHHKFLNMILNAKQTREIQSIDFIRDSKHCIAQVHWVAGYAYGDAYLCVLQNLSEDAVLIKNSLLEDHIRNLRAIYDRIELVDMNTGFSSNLFSSEQTKREYNRLPAQEELLFYADEEIYPEDREQFRRFADLHTIESRMKDSLTGYLSKPFRTRMVGGSYAWTLYIWLFAGDPSERRLLSCYRRLSQDELEFMHGRARLAPLSSPDSTDQLFTPALLWQNFTFYSDTCFFWKDKKRRFVGVNQKFLEYFGLPNADSLIGKTDEELGWHVDPEPYRLDEERVLTMGEQTFLIPGTCICRGTMRNIMASKMPIYRDGEIIGLMGYFLDLTDASNGGVQMDRISRLDPVTGSLSLLGLVDAVLHFQDSYVFRGRDFAMILFDIHHFHLFRQNYGTEWCNHLLAEISRRIRHVVDREGVTGRLNGDHFLVIRQFRAIDEIHNLISRVTEEIDGLREVDGVPCTIYLFSSHSVYTETKNLQQMLLDAEERLHRHPKKPK